MAGIVSKMTNTIVTYHPSVISESVIIVSITIEIIVAKKLTRGIVGQRNCITMIIAMTIAASIRNTIL